MGKTLERRNIIFHGRVQGVGFRYQAYETARQFGLTGWVKNLCDGTVEMEVQGEAFVIDQMLLALSSQGRYIRIDETESVICRFKHFEKEFRILN